MTRRRSSIRPLPSPLCARDAAATAQNEGRRVNLKEQDQNRGRGFPFPRSAGARNRTRSHAENFFP